MGSRGISPHIKTLYPTAVNFIFHFFAIFFNDPSQNAFLAAFTRDDNQLAQEVKKLLDNPSPETAKALLEKLPELLKDDPALAALIAEEMSKEFEGVGEVENSECRAKNPATCRTHGVPPVRMPARVPPEAHKQAQSLGYQDVNDIYVRAKAVSSDRISQIQSGFAGKCKAHEAIAVIRANKPFKDASGNDIQFGADILEHYVEGRRRRDNEPKIGNLEDLPFAIRAVMTDKNGATRIKFPRDAVPDVLNPPRGSQREYHGTTDRGRMKVFVYVQEGVINGWHIES